MLYCLYLLLCGYWQWSETLDWQRHYDRLIERARSRRLDGYGEWHHVLPRCMGGTDDNGNLVHLTPEEHFVAHQLLVKIHPGVRPLVFAIHAMLMCPRTKGRSANKEFGWLRRLNAIAVGDRRRGQKHTAEAIRKISAAQFGSIHTPERRQAISRGLTGKPKSPEHVAKVSAALMGKPGTRRGAVLTDKTKQKMREAALRRRYSPEAQAIRAAKAATVTPEQASARAHKAWATKRAKALAASMQEHSNG